MDFLFFTSLPDIRSFYRKESHNCKVSRAFCLTMSGFAVHFLTLAQGHEKGKRACKIVDGCAKYEEHLSVGRGLPP